MTTLHNVTPTCGYSATKDQLQNRLPRVEGQVRGVQAMVDQDRYRIDVLTQICDPGSARPTASRRSPWSHPCSCG
ncbi:MULTISPECIES: metal-sensitive transcriptional regulator [unclassified Spirillospora]|uniref:metal-sensitive transcriptional regulator n=1 Tax=unclassified Spirillospora TaxID=2642701 RepID=UPI0037210D31